MTISSEGEASVNGHSEWPAAGRRQQRKSPLHSRDDDGTKWALFATSQILFGSEPNNIADIRLSTEGLPFLIYLAHGLVSGG